MRYRNLVLDTLDERFLFMRNTPELKELSAPGPKRHIGWLIFSSAVAWDADTVALVSMTSV